MSSLIRNMMEMEIELRAHSILLDALTQRVITPEEVADHLQMARKAPAMLAYVREKYRVLALKDPFLNEQRDAVPTRMMPRRSDARYEL